MRKSKFTDNHVMDAVKRVEADFGVPDICLEMGISTATFYKWRAKCGGLDVSIVSRIKELEEQNRRLKKMCLEEKLKAEIVSEALEKVVRPSRRMEMAMNAVKERGICFRVACQVFRISKFCCRYERKLDTENEEVATLLIKLTDNNRNWGLWPLLPLLAQPEGLQMETQACLSGLF